MGDAVCGRSPCFAKEPTKTRARAAKATEAGPAVCLESAAGAAKAILDAPPEQQELYEGGRPLEGLLPRRQEILRGRGAGGPQQHGRHKGVAWARAPLASSPPRAVRQHRMNILCTPTGTEKATCGRTVRSSCGSTAAALGYGPRFIAADAMAWSTTGRTRERIVEGDARRENSAFSGVSARRTRANT